MQKRRMLTALCTLVFLWGVYHCALHLIQRLDSDFLFPYSFLLDAWRHPETIKGWSVTPNLYVVPDLLIMVAAQLPQLDVWQTHTLAVILTTSLLSLALASLYVRLDAGAWEAWLSSLVTVAAILLVFAWGAHHRLLLSYYLLPGAHGGALIWGLVFISILLHSLSLPRGTLWLSGATALGVWSDSVFTVQFVAPALLLLGFRLHMIHRTSRPRTRLVTVQPSSVLTDASHQDQGSRMEDSKELLRQHLKLLLGGLFLGFILIYLVKALLVVVPSPHVKMFPSLILNSILQLTTDLWSEPPLLILAISCAAMTLGAGWRWLQEDRESAFRSAHFVAVILGLGGLLSAVAATISAQYSDVTGWRYMLLLFLAPLLMAGRSLVLRLSHGARQVLCCSLVLSVWLGYWLQDPRAVRGFYPRLLECLDELAEQHQLRYGLSDYWRAKYVSFLGKSALQVHQIKPQGGVYHWINNRYWYVGSEPSQQAYDFVLAQGLDADELLRRIGRAPDRIVVCPESEVWIYQGVHRERLSSLLQSGVTPGA